MPIRWFLAPLAAAAFGCSSQVRGLHDGPIEVPALPAASGPPVSLLVCRFSELRGDRFSRHSPTDAIPVANLFYTGTTVYHVERAGFLAAPVKGRPQVVLGVLTSDLPDMIAASIRSARPGWKIEVTASEERCASGGDATYVIDGAIRRTELRQHGNLLPLGLLSVFGVPGSFVDFTGEFDVEVRRADTGRAAWNHTFQAEERRAVGLYYNRRAGQELFSALLRDTVERTAAGAIHVAERGS